MRFTASQPTISISPSRNEGAEKSVEHAPGVTNNGGPLGTIYRVRCNFRQWAVLNSIPLVVSPIDLYWFSRESIVVTSGGDQLKSDVSGDNIAGEGVTNTTWNLQ